MGRPKAVSYARFSLYDKLHTTKTKMYSGVEMTTLYPIKETPQFYLSPEVWAYCASKFKIKKKNLSELKVDIPVITNQKTIDFLDKKCWRDWVDKQLKSGKTDMIETVNLFSKLFPNKKPIYFYELNSLLSAYNSGNFISYDKNGNVEEPSEHAIEQRKYYTQKYCRLKKIDTPNYITELYEKYSAISEKQKALKEKAFDEWYNAESDYISKNNDLTDTFLDIGLHSVCYPVAFSKGTAEWYKEKYGKKCGYGEAGEIFFVVTPDAIYFDITRHY